MGDALNLNEPKVDYDLLERVNPVFHTAKMTLFQLAASGDADAAALAEAMGLTRESTQDSANTTASPEQVLAGTVLLESRYRTMTRLAESSGYTLVDLPCGYTPRGIAFARKGLPYYGLDLPAVIREISGHAGAMVAAGERELLHYREVDATNYASLEKAVEDIEGAICVTTEGLLMYFTESEVGALCDNMRRILESKGGCWYIADTESHLQYVTILRALAGERFAEIMQNAKQQVIDKSDVAIGKNSLITKQADMAGGTERAMAFLAEHGLRAERVTVADHLPELDSLPRVSPEQAIAVREGMKHCAFWKVTPGEASSVVELTPSESGGCAIHASVQDGTLSIALTGRLDTITAPTLLAFFDDAREKHSVEAVAIDCSSLEYISSAGLRVIVTMRKNCRGGVTLISPNELIVEILEQTGFAAVLTIA